MAAHLAKKIGAQAILPKYRLAPEAPYPAAPEDVRSAWHGIIASGISPEDIILGGDSAGGALAFGLVAALCGEGAQLPAAVFAFSPLTDLTLSGESFTSNAEAEAVLAAERAQEMVDLYLNGHNGADPCASPLHASFKGGPPTWVTVGDTEVLFDDARRMIAKLEAEGVETRLVVEHDLPHVWPIFHNALPEARHTLDVLAQSIRQQQNREV